MPEERETQPGTTEILQFPIETTNGLALISQFIGYFKLFIPKHQYLYTLKREDVSHTSETERPKPLLNKIFASFQEMM